MIAIMSLFQGCLQALELRADRELRFDPGAVVFRTGEPVKAMFLVKQGAVRLVRNQPSGDALVLQRALPGDLLAEASLFSRSYHCDAVASEPALLLRVPKQRVAQLQQDDPVWLAVFAAHLAGEVQRTRARAELLSLKRVGQRLDAWLSLHGGALPDRGRWAELALELAVTPEALYRELAARR